MAAPRRTEGGGAHAPSGLPAEGENSLAGAAAAALGSSSASGSSVLPDRAVPLVAGQVEMVEAAPPPEFFQNLTVAVESIRIGNSSEPLFANAHLAVEVPPSAADFSSGTKFFLTPAHGERPDVVACVAIDQDDVISVFKHFDYPGGATSITIPKAIEQGGRKLNCFTHPAPLPEIYSRCGFIPVARVAFDEDEKPPGWNSDLQKPDLIFMVYSPNFAKEYPLDVPDKAQDRKSQIGRMIEDLPVVAYDKAAADQRDWVDRIRAGNDWAPAES